MVLVCAYQVMFANIDINGAISGFYITVVTNALILIIFDVLFNWKKRSKYEHLFLFLLYIVFTYFNCMIMNVKSIIGFVNPYSFDEVISNFDNMLHFGFYPYELLNITSWSAYAISLIDQMYVLWFFITVGWLSYSFLQLSSIRAQKIIISYIMCWLILGAFTATYYASVGPIFWSGFYDVANPYVPLMDHLKNVNETYPLFAFVLRDLLLDFQNSNEIVNLNAPSAMPSMHVSIAALMLFSIPRGYLVWKIAAFLFLVVIMVGSVVLGWHYAVDGYVALTGTYVIWKTTSIFLNRYNRWMENQNRSVGKLYS